VLKLALKQMGELEKRGIQGSTKIKKNVDFMQKGE
jgi:hypothetical protein